MTLYRGSFLDTPVAGELRTELDGGLLVRDGVVVARGVVHAPAGEEVVDLTGGLVLPGFVDTHVHYPQVRAIGGLGMPLLDWLERCALPEECRLADVGYARTVAAEFVDGLARAGTTSALVFGSHFAPAVDALFTEADRVGLRVTSGLVVSDRLLPEALLTTPERALAEGARWRSGGTACGARGTR
ncbi:amidohydrolase family protein [Klenkia terrae]|uniref:amidohydrolase family protein n=1 Tax=Klenkia terrae TaxID=1052259 RepID=UPI00361F9E08